MANKEWRPQNPFVDVIPPPDVVLERSATYLKGKHDGYEAGASAMLKADVEYLDGECTGGHQYYHSYYLGWLPFKGKRKDCPECYKAWKNSTAPLA